MLNNTGKTHNDPMDCQTYFFDTVVIGGGTAGVAAALNAAQEQRVLILENKYALGGASTLGQVTPRMSTYVNGFKTATQDLLTKYAIAYGATPQGSDLSNWFNPELYKIVLDKITAIPNISVLFGATINNISISEETIRSITVHALSTTYEISANNFIDATGEAIIASLCGVTTESGNAENGHNQNVSLRFTVANVDTIRLKKFLTENGHIVSDNDNCYEFSFLWTYERTPYFEIYEKAVNDGELNHDDVMYIQAYICRPLGEGLVYFNCPESPIHNHSTDPFELSEAVSYCREVISRLLRFYMKHFDGFENCILVSISDYPGVRDGNRIIGKYTLTEDDYLNSRKFNDGIAQCAYPIDIHGAHGLRLAPLNENDYYEIPYRTLICNEIKNLIVVGRCISASFKAQSSTRIQAICIATGEAAGQACIISQNNRIALNNINGALVRKAMQNNGTVFMDK